jgi:hypothetical protein
VARPSRSLLNRVPAVDPTEAAEQRALEMRLERGGVLLAYEIVF